jgi:hypothetical protein
MFKPSNKILVWIIFSVMEIALISILGSLVATRLAVGEYLSENSFLGISQPNIHDAFIGGLQIFVIGTVVLGFLSLTRFRTVPYKATILAAIVVIILLTIRWLLALA